MNLVSIGIQVETDEPSLQQARVQYSQENHWVSLHYNQCFHGGLLTQPVYRLMEIYR